MFIQTPFRESRIPLTTLPVSSRQEQRPISMDDKQIQIVIADDHAVLRESLATLLETQHDMKVIGKATNGHEALLLVQEHQPDASCSIYLCPRAMVLRY